MKKEYVIWDIDSHGEVGNYPDAAFEEMIYFGKNSTNCCFPGIEVTEENEGKLKKLVKEYNSLKEEEQRNLSLVDFFKAKGIDIRPVEEFEEPRDIFILLIYFKEICLLTDFDSMLVLDKAYLPN